MTAAVTASAVKQGVNNSKNKELTLKRFKTGCFTLPTTTTSADTTTIDLQKEFGITRFMGIRGFQHTTENSVIEDETILEQAIAATERIVGDFTRHHTGLLFVVPAIRVLGLEKRDIDN